MTLTIKVLIDNFGLL